MELSEVCEDDAVPYNDKEFVRKEMKWIIKF